MTGHDLTSTATGPTPGEARAALHSVEEMRLAAIRRGMPPRWLGVMISFWFGGMWTLLTLDRPVISFVIWTGLWIIVALTRYRSLATLARNVQLDVTPRVVVAQVAAVAVLLGLFVGARVVGQNVSPPGIALVGGTLAAGTIYTLFSFKRRIIRQRIEAEYDR